MRGSLPQTFMRFHLAKGKYEEMVRRANAIEKLQTNIRAFILLKDWEWMKIIFKIKPLISQAENEKEMLELEKNYNDVKDQLEKERKRRTELEGLKKVMEEERDELEAVMGKQMSAIEDRDPRTARSSHFSRSCSGPRIFKLIRVRSKISKFLMVFVRSGPRFSFLKFWSESVRRLKFFGPFFVHESLIEDIEGRCDELITIKIDLDTKMEELQEKLDDEEELNSDLIKHRRKLEIESEKLKNEIQDLETNITKTQKEFAHSEYKTKSVTVKIEELEERVAKLKKAKLLNSTGKKTCIVKL